MKEKINSTLAPEASGLDWMCLHVTVLEALCHQVLQTRTGLRSGQQQSTWAQVSWGPVTLFVQTVCLLLDVPWVHGDLGP